ncbi:MAG: DNA-directed RNA polymerase subunit delta [Negativicutes bacterium]|nr:DNA-directed RNA polymerase subunit delta [Negativicutes bacterium]
MLNKPHQQSETDLAYKILQETGRPIYFRDLINQVLEAKGGPVHSPAHVIAEIHTLINMDSRFNHMGKGMWGLTEWVPQRGARYLEEAMIAANDAKLRREKLLEEIQQDFVAATVEPEEAEDHS